VIERLSEFPWVLVRIECPLCPRRKGQYRLARLADKFGSEIGLEELLDRIAFDCPWRRSLRPHRARKYIPECKARFTDLDRPPRPPDLPRSLLVLRVLSGGKQ
jgi:hypothetical protein